MKLNALTKIEKNAKNILFFVRLDCLAKFSHDANGGNYNCKQCCVC